MSFRRDTKSHWSLLSGIYARGSKRSHTGKWKKPVVDSVHLTVLVISISKLTILPPNLVVISCKGSISSSISWVASGRSPSDMYVRSFMLSSHIFLGLLPFSSAFHSLLQNFFGDAVVGSVCMFVCMDVMLFLDVLHIGWQTFRGLSKTQINTVYANCTVHTALFDTAKLYEIHL